ncbi:retrotransposon protein, putative, ty1-copia subclass [Tanacetum coccineum]
MYGSPMMDKLQEKFKAGGTKMTTSIVLSIEDKLNYLEQPLSPPPVALDGQQVAPEIIAAHNAWIKGSKEIVGLMLITMEPEIQQNLENLHANDMLKDEEGQSVSSYILKIKSYIDDLERLGHPVTLGLAVSLILIGLRKEFDGFVQNYNMHSLGKTVNELHAMLNLHEQTLPKNNAPALHVIRVGKGTNKLAYAPKPKIPPPPKREDPAKDSICHECGETGHWKRNCPQYLAELLKKKKNAASGAVVQWIRDCFEQLSLCSLYYRGVIFVSRLYKDGFINRFVNNTIQVSRNNMVYFSVIPRDGIFEIDLSNSYANESSIYIVSNKRAKLDLDSALLWHCRLGHISKKRIEKLQHDGLLNSTDLRAFEKCVPCMSGKMARKPYTHQVEREKDLLGLIHTDVCGPFKIMSRQRASYFLTFTNDFSRYGYVYLLKHKHEVFETFKVFQKEVENQLGKIIKSLRSDRGGEYISQEFLDHLKDHRIITHHTTPYTPQHNGYPKETMGYSFYYPPENKVLVAWNAEFLENSLITQEASGSLEDLEIIQEEDTHPSIDTSLNHEDDDLEIDEPHSDIIRIRDLGEPANYKAALLDPESDKWLNAMNVEIQSMKDNEVWDLVDLPPNGKTVGSKWLFKKKTNMDGAVHTYKARLMAKGYTQTSGIDYEETFSPVADIKILEVYMEQPEGFVNPKYPNRVCKLKRSIYGLKQASRNE